jgi:sigma-E factor negative regulatory protein RseC
MLREEGRVVEREAHHAVVESQRKRACGTCHGESSCSTLSGGLGQSSVRIRAHNPLGAEIGDWVTVEISEQQFLRASFLVYGLPLMALFAVGALVRAILLAMGMGQAAEGLAALAGLAALGITLFLIGRIPPRMTPGDPSQPVITHIRSHAATIPIQPINGA